MNKPLFLGGASSLLVAALHLAIIWGGPAWYRFFGAGERMAILAEEGSWTPALVTLGLTIIFALWGLYAFSAAGLFRPLPWQRLVLIAVAAIYILRGVMLLPVWLFRPEEIDLFLFLTSLVSLGIGLLYALGIHQLGKLIPMNFKG